MPTVLDELAVKLAGFGAELVALEERLAGLTQVREQLELSWWELRGAGEAAEAWRMQAERELAELREGAIIAEEMAAGQRQQISALIARSGQAPPPTWLARAARRSERLGLLEHEAAEIGRKCLRWAQSQRVRGADLQARPDHDGTGGEDERPQ